jgi:hypothetical protein
LTAYDSLIKFWREYPVDNNGGVHPKDKIPENKIAHVAGISGYTKSARFLNDGKLIHAGLLPGPYCGNIQKAKVYFLGLNPGFSPGDFHAEADAEFRKAALANLAQQGRTLPFMPLEPRFCWTGGAGWWRKKLRPLLEKYRERGVSSLEACKDMSGKIASLELFPYHSASFDGSGGLLKIESVHLIKAFAQEASKDRSKLFVVLRRTREWGLDRRDNIITLSPGEARQASIAGYRDEIFRYLVDD